MNRAELIAFVRRHRYAVQASTAVDGSPQAAVVGIAVRVRVTWARYFRAGGGVVEIPVHPPGAALV